MSRATPVAKTLPVGCQRFRDPIQVTNLAFRGLAGQPLSQVPDFVVVLVLVDVMIDVGIQIV